MNYLVKRARRAPRPTDEWSGERWSIAETLEVSHFHPRSSDHRPLTRARLLHDDSHLNVYFHVRDRFVRCVHTTYQSRVSQDSCVEFFLQPDPARGYFNFEFNCGGTLLLYYIEDPTRTEDAPFRKFSEVPQPLARSIQVWSSLPRRVDPEIDDALDWTLGCAVPFSIFEPWVGRVEGIAGRHWRGNFFKCADGTSHPHWASWSPIGETLRFHQPERFGVIAFEQ